MKVLVQLITSFTTFFAALFFIFWSFKGHLNPQITAIFDHHKLSTTEQQADHLADLTYYYAIYVILLSTTVRVIRFFRKQFNQVVQGDSETAANINHLIRNSLEHLLLFVSVYVYLLQKHGLGLKAKALLLLPFWFLLGRALTFLELLINSVQSLVKVSMLGWTLSVVPFIFMFAQIAGFSPLKYF